MKFFKKQTKLIQVAQFFLVFNLLALPMYFILLADLSFLPLQDFLAAMTSQVLQLQKIPAVSSGSFVTIFDTSGVLRNIQISFDSTGWKSVYALVALIIATPLPSMRRKLRFLAVGVPAIFVLNFLRIWSTIWYSYVYGWENFDVIHTLLWREGLIALVLLFWFFWLRDAVRLESHKRPLKPLRQMPKKGSRQKHNIGRK